ncbi:uncharacterized protein LOC123871908 [Maniola jurtina]|uniref:uncharacterized protein LOC123871908 n=1 Tax=Maniola jurtina TaxID=191418 RepID=UPI001E68F822|nr:uncharacterized protein LOC123871908 [Maniola jurtina]
MSGASEEFDENEIGGFLVEEKTKYYESPANSISLKGELPEAQDYKVYDYPQQEIERIRDRRESDFIPMKEDSSQEKFLMPLYCITAIFAGIMIVGPFLVKRGPNRGIIQASILLTAFCMWIFWFTIYFGTMNPLMGPRLENTTVAWIAYKLGKPFNTT